MISTKKKTILGSLRLAPARATLLCLSPAMLLDSSQSEKAGMTHSRGSRIEQSLAGIKVGDTVTTAKARFPGMRMTGGMGVWTAGIGANCRIEVYAGESSDVNGGIEVVTLERVNNGNLNKDAQCDGLKTGASLRFGATLTELQLAYSGLRLMEEGKDPALYRTDNKVECIAGATPILRSMMVYWSVRFRRIETISVSAGRKDCQEYRDAARDR